jgi:hypothetical protein
MNKPVDPPDEWTLYIVVTNRDVFLKECVGSFRKIYPLLKIVLLDNSGGGRFRHLGESLDVEIHATNKVLSVSENQNWILDNCKTRYFIFSADDIAFLQGGFLEESAALHQKGFELVSLGVDDPCAFSMQTFHEPKIGRFNTGLAGKEKTDLDIKARCESVHGFLPSVGGYWRETPDAWESRYIRHYRFKPDVNKFLMERGLTGNQVNNEKVLQKHARLLKSLERRASSIFKAQIVKYGNLLLRKGLPGSVFEIGEKLPEINWRNRRILSVGQMPGNYFWPQCLGRFLGSPTMVEKVIVEKCEAFKPFLEKKFTSEKGYKIIADDVLNIDKLCGRGSVDLAVWYDGPAHLDKELAYAALKKIEQVCSGLILIGTSQGFHPQGTDDSFKKIQNPYNTHLSGWDVSEFEQLGYQTHVCRKPIPTIVAWKYLDSLKWARP